MQKGDKVNYDIFPGKFKNAKTPKYLIAALSYAYAASSGVKK